MVEVDHKIIIVGLFCLTIIFVALLMADKLSETLGTFIIGMIGLAIGIVVPSPKINNKRGVLIWQTKKNLTW